MTIPIFSLSSPSRALVVVDGVTCFKSEWMNTGDDPAFSPKVFLVEQPPDVSLRTHFHRNNQFQLFLRGNGSIRPRPLGVHYAGAYKDLAVVI